jgi:hypothetical protein
MTDSDGHNFDLMTFPEEEWGKRDGHVMPASVLHLEKRKRTSSRVLRDRRNARLDGYSRRLIRNQLAWPRRLRPLLFY